MGDVDADLLDATSWLPDLQRYFSTAHFDGPLAEPTNPLIAAGFDVDPVFGVADPDPAVDVVDPGPNFDTADLNDTSDGSDSITDSNQGEESDQDTSSEDQSDPEVAMDEESDHDISNEDLNIGQETPLVPDPAATDALPHALNTPALVPQPQAHPIFELDMAVFNLQPWASHLDTFHPTPRPLIPNTFFDWRIILHRPDLEPVWHRVVMVAFYFSPLRVVRRPWGRTIEQRRGDSQQEVLASGSNFRRSFGIFFQPRFDYPHPANGHLMVFGSLELTHTTILDFVGSRDERAEATIIAALLRHIVPRITAGRYGELPGLQNYLQNPPALTDLDGIMYGSTLFRDIISVLFLGHSNTSTVPHWQGFGPSNPRTPIYLQANVAIFATWAVSVAEAEMGSIVPVPRLESLDLNWHIARLLELWNSPVTFPRMARLDDMWIAIGAGGAFID